MRGCPDDLAVLTFLELQDHLAHCRSCARLVAELARRPEESRPEVGVNDQQRGPRLHEP